MERLTTDKPISEMSMVELAHNSCFAKNGEAYYRDFDGEISARDLARRLYKQFTSEELSKDNDTFDVEMMEELRYDIEIYPEGVVALLYRNLWAMADLREQLKSYEDLGDIEEIIEIKERATPMKIRKPLPNIYECPWCGETEGINPIISYCPWCSQKLES